MNRLIVALAILLSSNSASAQTLVFPAWFDSYFFMGSSEDLYRIRAAMAYVAGYEPEAWTFPSSYTYTHTLIQPPSQLGEFDCMDSYYRPNQGPYDGAEDYLGMSVNVPGLGVVEVPALEDMVSALDPAWKSTPCYGYYFNLWCGGFFGSWNCPPPAPQEP